MLKRETAIKMAQYFADREQVFYCVFQVKNDACWSFKEDRDFSPADTGDTSEMPVFIMPVRQ